MTNDFNPTSVFKRLDNLRGYGHAANIFNIASCHRLTPRDDGKRLHDSARIFRRALWTQTLKIALHRGTTLKAPTACELGEFHTAVKPCLLQLFKCNHDLLVSDLVAIDFKQLAQFI